MNSHNNFKKTLWLVILGLMVPLTSFAQSATASFDPSSPVFMAAAAGWRDTKAFSLTYWEKSGQRDWDDTSIHDYSGDGTTAQLTYASDEYHFEMDSLSEKIKVKSSDIQPGAVLTGLEENSVLLAIRAKDMATIGLGLRTTKNVLWLPSQDIQTSTNRTSRQGSVTMKLGSWFHAGLGAEKITETSEMTVENEWNATTFSVAIKTGEPGQTRFRAEIGFTESASSDKGTEGDLLESRQPDIDIIRGQIELDMGGLLFSLHGTETTEYQGLYDPVSGKTVSRIKHSSTEGGVLWIPPGGMMLGFSFLNQSTQSLYYESFNAFKVKFGYIF